MWDKFESKIPGLKDISTIGTVDILGNAFSAVFWLYIAGILGAENYGEISYFLAIASIASVIALLGTENVMTVLTAKKLKVQSTIYYLVAASSSITSIIVFIILSRFEISFLVIGYVIAGLAISDIIGRKLFKEYAKYLIIHKILIMVLGIGFYYLIGTNGVILGISLASLPFLVRIFKSCKETKFELNILKNKAKFIITNYAITLSNSFGGSTDKLIIAPLLGFTLLGNYQLGIQFLAILHILPSIVYKYVLPHDASGESNSRLKILTVIVSVGIAIIAFFFSPLVVSQIFPKYLEAIEIIPLLSLSIIPTTISIFYSSKFLGKENNLPIFLGSITYITILVTLMITLGSMYDLIGVAIAYNIAVVIEMIYYIFMDKWYNTKDQNQIKNN